MPIQSITGIENVLGVAGTLEPIEPALRRPLASCGRAGRDHRAERTRRPQE